jgi:hypothetical protein
MCSVVVAMLQQLLLMAAQRLNPHHEPSSIMHSSKFLTVAVLYAIPDSCYILLSLLTMLLKLMMKRLTVTVENAATTLVLSDTWVQIV